MNVKRLSGPVQTDLDPWQDLRWQVDGSGNLVCADAAWLNFTGLHPTEAEGTGWQVCLHPEDRRANLERWAAGLSAGDAFSLTWRLRDQHGLYHLFLNRALKRQDGGWNLHAVNIEAAQEHLQQAALAAAGAHTERLLERAGVAVLEFDDTHTVRFASREAQAALGGSGASLCGRSLRELMPLLLNPEVLDRIASPHTPARSAAEAQIGVVKRWVKFAPQVAGQGFTVYFRSLELQPPQPGVARGVTRAGVNKN